MHVVPGQALGLARDLAAGEGAHVWGDTVRASIAGVCTVDAATATVASSSRKRSAARLPQVGDAVLCKVMRLEKRAAAVSIMCGGKEIPGILRREDLRVQGAAAVAGSAEVGGEMRRACRPGDLLQARVLAVGDSRGMYVTIGARELGVSCPPARAPALARRRCALTPARVHVQVVHAAIDGVTLSPLSPDWMVCPVSHAREPRKVAMPPALEGVLAPPEQAECPAARAEPKGADAPSAGSKRLAAGAAAGHAATKRPRGKK